MVLSGFAMVLTFALQGAKWCQSCLHGKDKNRSFIRVASWVVKLFMLDAYNLCVFNFKYFLLSTLSSHQAAHPGPTATASKIEHHSPLPSQTVLNDQDVAKCEDLDSAYAAATYDGRLDWQPSLPSDSSVSSSYPTEMIKSECPDDENAVYARRPSCSIVESLLNRKGACSNGSEGSFYARKRAHRNLHPFSKNDVRNCFGNESPAYLCNTLDPPPLLSYHPNQSCLFAMMPNPVDFMRHSTGSSFTNVLREHNLNFYCPPQAQPFDNYSIPIPSVMLPTSTSRSRHSTGNSSSSTSLPPFCPSSQFSNVSTSTLPLTSILNTSNTATDIGKPIVSMTTNLESRKS